MNIANSSNELKDFIQNISRKFKHRLTAISMEDQSNWSFEDGILSHSSKGFFNVTGVENINNVSDQDLILYQPQSALTGLLLCKKNGGVYVLLQARIEPGNTGIIQYGPTVQSTPANYLKMHGGKSTPFIDEFIHFKPGINLITHSIQHDLGKRYYQKSKSHHYIETEDLVPCDDHMIWASTESIFRLLSENNLLNVDLRSLLAVFNWDDFYQDKSIETKTVSAIFNDKNIIIPSSKHRLTTITALNNWEITNTKVASKKEGLPTICMFHFIGESREVSQWSQPLFCVEGMGLVQLITRTINSTTEYLITVGNEAGISTDFAVYPTNYWYAEETKNIESSINGELISEFIQCDEGGRFYKNDVKYQLYKVAGNFEHKENQHWITNNELKQILTASNVASFQLRCICSGILDLLNPTVFK
ncbi:NDP-hexose 2,3-dehydratase family protein [Wenyingzhuangia sp. IMCC45533]